MNNLMIKFLLFYLATKSNCYSHFSLVSVNFGHLTTILTTITSFTKGNLFWFTSTI